MHRYKLFWFLLVAAVYSASACAEDAAIAALFAQRGVNGTLMLVSLQNGQTFIHNDVRVKQRFPVASTFKILNTLIALEEQAISGKDEVLKWDGQIRAFPDWNHDQTLASAFKVSCVWCYQQLAQRVGHDKYRDYLHKLAYGELREPFKEATFWLDGSLQISASEQVAFLKQVYQRTLPFSTVAYDVLRDIMVVEQTLSFTLRAKTGWAMRASPQIGWYVGYLETGQSVWFFAMNMNIRDKKYLPLRQQLVRLALQGRGIIE